MMLNGWQRIGVVLSALWLLSAPFFDPFEISGGVTGWWLVAILFIQILAFWIIAYAALFAFRWVRNGFSSDRKSASSGNEEAVAAPSQVPEDIVQSAPEAISRTDNTALPPIKPLAPSKRQIATSVIFLLMMYGLVFIYALAGLTFEFKGNELVYFLFTGGLAFWYLWRGLNRRGWIGAIVGVAVSLLVLFFGAGFAGYVRSQPNYILEHDPIFAAIKKSYPEDYEKILQTFVAKYHNKNMSREELLAQLKPIVQTNMKRALRTTSDDALLQFGRVKVQMFQEVAALNADDCLSIMLGRSDHASQLRTMASLSKKTNDAMSDAKVKIFNDAGSLKTASAVMATPLNPLDQFDTTTATVIKDPIRFEALFRDLDAKLTSTYGTSAYYLMDDSLNKPADVRCKAGLLLFKEVLNLPPKDRSFMLREFFGGE